MLNTTIYAVIFTAFAASLVGTCSAKETPQTPDRIDADSLLADLQEILRKTPDSEKGCQAPLREIRAWQQRKSREFKKQLQSSKYSFENQRRIGGQLLTLDGMWTA